MIRRPADFHASLVSSLRSSRSAYTPIFLARRSSVTPSGHRSREVKTTGRVGNGRGGKTVSLRVIPGRSRTTVLSFISAWERLEKWERFERSRVFRPFEPFKPFQPFQPFLSV